MTANLDDENVEIILEILSKYVGNGGILIMVTHDNRIKKIADEIYMIDDKKIERVLSFEKEN